MFSNKYSVLVLGETGVGKSSFVNAITKSQKMEVGHDGKAQTTCYDVMDNKYKGNTYIFIDTPGLNDAKGDEKNIKQLKDAAVEYPDFRCILLLMKFQDVRLSDSMVKILENYMTCFPLREFWKHVIMIRTRADTSNKKFERERKKIEGCIVKCIRDKDYENFRNFMSSHDILLPDKIEEYYVDCDNEDSVDDRFEFNESQFNLIFEHIKDCPKMFKDIKKIDNDEMDKSSDIQKLVTKRTIIFIDQQGKEITNGPFIIKETELCNHPIVRKEKLERSGTIKSECRKTKVHMYYYEINVYNIDGKEVKGDKCLKKSEWKVKS